ncbi:hypothetical protein J437_LFUL005027 [Ladona fulva]|uniref:Dynein assembly factor 1, axonemal homolog n=1 Tax=Ladona fulva TaxID=123851 RepID=A0A8K0JUU6_LADFU|nr:hypothetical protein J437_LFUL005027 [Ladona fulva]
MDNSMEEFASVEGPKNSCNENEFFKYPRSGYEYLLMMTKEFLRGECKKKNFYLTPHLNDVLYLHYKGRLPVLHTLLISHNRLANADDIMHLVECKSLSVVDLSHNHLSGAGILEADLTYLDDRPVFPRDRVCAEAWQKGGIEAEREALRQWNEDEQKKTLASVMALVKLRDERRAAMRRKIDQTFLNLEDTMEDGIDIYLHPLFQEEFENISKKVIASEEVPIKNVEVTESHLSSQEKLKSTQFNLGLNENSSKELLTFEKVENDRINPEIISIGSSMISDPEVEIDEVEENKKSDVILMPWEIREDYRKRNAPCKPLIQEIISENEESRMKEREIKNEYQNHEQSEIKILSEPKEVIVKSDPNERSHEKDDISMLQNQDVRYRHATENNDSNVSGARKVGDEVVHADDLTKINASYHVTVLGYEESKSIFSKAKSINIVSEAVLPIYHLEKFEENHPVTSGTGKLGSSHEYEEDIDCCEQSDFQKFYGKESSYSQGNSSKEFQSAIFPEKENESAVKNEKIELSPSGYDDAAQGSSEAEMRMENEEEVAEGKLLGKNRYEWEDSKKIVLNTIIDRSIRDNFANEENNYILDAIITDYEMSSANSDKNDATEESAEQDTLVPVTEPVLRKQVKEDALMDDENITETSENFLQEDGKTIFMDNKEIISSENNESCSENISLSEVQNTADEVFHSSSLDNHLKIILQDDFKEDETVSEMECNTSRNVKNDNVSSDLNLETVLQYEASEIGESKNPISEFFGEIIKSNQTEESIIKNGEDILEKCNCSGICKSESEEKGFVSQTEILPEAKSPNVNEGFVEDKSYFEGNISSNLQTNPVLNAETKIESLDDDEETDDKNIQKLFPTSIELQIALSD